MNKSTKILKRLLALFLVVLMSINSFGAVVSDNDGSAFITKAEFDSLKNDFQTQIDQYNTSIDSKIDGAIAAYLSGIRTSKITELSLAKSILLYPLTIYNDEYEWTFEHWNEQTPDNKWWYLNVNNNYFSLADWPNNYGANGASIQTAQYVWRTNVVNKLRDFYFVTDIDGTLARGKITGRRVNWAIYRVGAGLLYVPARDFYPQAVGYGVLVRRDQLTPNYMTAGGGTGTVITFTNLVETGTDLFRSDNPDQWIPLQTYLSANYATGVLSENYSQWTKTNNSSCWWNYNDNTEEMRNLMQSNEIKMNYEQVNGISNLWTGVNENMYLPVLWDGVLYWTNSQTLKYDNTLLAATEITTYTYDHGSLRTAGPSQTSSILYADIDCGEVLEMEGHQINTSHPWYNCALAYGSHFYYEVTVPNKKQTYDLGLCDGILLTDLPTGNNIDNMKIELNLDFEDNEQRYLMVSKYPIEKYTTTEPVASDRLLKVYDNETGAGTGNSLYPLQEGTNKVYVMDVAGGDNIYIKIVWNNTNTKYTRIVEPPIVSITVN